MKKNIFSFLICLLITCYASQAQTNNPENIIQHLETNSSDSGGVIHVESDPAITALIGKPNNSITISGSTEIIEGKGFRLQVFTGNSPKTARSEAASRQTSIKNKFTDLPLYLKYEAPNWKLLAGDFVTREEAAVMKKRLEKEFPQFGKEIFIIASKIRIPIETGE